METKLFELRDRGTFTVLMVTRLGGTNERDEWLLSRAGFGKTSMQQIDYCIFSPMMDLSRTTYDSYQPRSRTYDTAYSYIQENWDNLKSGDVVCVEHILGEREEPKASEQHAGF